MLQAKLDRIDPGQDRQLIDRTLGREHIRIGAKRSQRRHPERHVRQEMPLHLFVGDHIEGVGIAVSIARRGDLHLCRLRHGGRCLVDAGKE